METIRVGCDIVPIARFKRILTRTPGMRSRIFLPQELKNASLERLAGIFAAKEAAVKALGLPPGSWHEIEIIYHKTGKPQLQLLSRTKKYIISHDLSIAHDGDYAIAFVCCLEKSTDL